MKTKDVKMAQANDVITDEEVNQEIVLQNAHNDAKAIDEAKAKVEATKLAYDEAKALLRKVTGKKGKSEKSGPGVIATILTLVTNSGKTGISKADILAKLVEIFPDRSSEGMEKTINVQLPKRMSAERNVKIEKTDKGNFILVK